MASYFLLIVRLSPVEPWTSRGGDHDREYVMTEKEDLRQHDKVTNIHPKGAADCYKVIAVKSARRAHCDAALKRLNAKEA